VVAAGLYLLLWLKGGYFNKMFIARGSSSFYLLSLPQFIIALAGIKPGYKL
jgi:hypothetical protein